MSFRFLSEWHVWSWMSVWLWMSSFGACSMTCSFKIVLLSSFSCKEQLKKKSMGKFMTGSVMCKKDSDNCLLPIFDHLPCNTSPTLLNSCAIGQWCERTCKYSYASCKLLLLIFIGNEILQHKITICSKVYLNEHKFPCTIFSKR